MNENWTANNPPPELSDADAELLSAYIDNALDPQERAAFEARLAADAFLRSELAATRQMLGWLNTMPTLKAPRNFTITEADVAPAKPKIVPMPRRFNWQIASTAAAVFVVLFAFVAANLQFNLTPKQDELDNLAFASTQDNQTELQPATSLPLPMATMGVPQVENSTANDAVAQTDEQEESAPEAARSIDTDMAYDPEMSPSADANFAAPEASTGGSAGGSGGMAMENANPDDSSMAGGSAPVGEAAETGISVMTSENMQETPASVEAENMILSVAVESTEDTTMAMSVPVDEAAVADAQIAMASVPNFDPRVRLLETIRLVYERLKASFQN